MKKIFAFCCLIPILSAAQKLPRFEKDTLYTSSGYKIYKGQVLQFGKGTQGGKFLYVNVKTKVARHMLDNHAVLVKELKGFDMSILKNGYIDVKGTLIVNGNPLEDIEIHLSFDYAIENLPHIPSELIVPNEYRGKRKINPSQEIQRVKKLYQYGTISMEELEWQEKQLLAMQ